MLRSVIVALLIALQAAAASFSINAGDNPIAQVGTPGGSDPHNGMDAQTAKYVESFNEDPGQCVHRLPTMKEGYTAKFANIDFQTGVTTFYVYKGEYSEKREAQVSFVNEACAKIATKEEVSAEVLSRSERWNAKGSNTSTSNKIQDLEEKYFVHYTGGAKKFLTTSEYILACITMDGEIIDIQTTIDRNQITLNPGYTIYPNDNRAAPSEFYSEIKEKAKDIWNATVGRTAAAFGYDAMLEKDKEYGAKQLIGLTEAAMTNVMAFIFNFVGGNGDILVKLQVIMFFGFGAASLALASLSKVTKKVSEMGDYNDLGEKGVWLIGMLILFYAETASYQNERDNISKNLFQGGYATLAHNMIEISDDMTKVLATSFVDFKGKDAGILGEKELSRVLVHKTSVERQKVAYQGNFDQCREFFKEGMHQLPGFNFAPLSAYVVGFEVTETSLYLQPDQYPWQSQPLTVDFCYNMEKSLYENEKALQVDEKILEAYENAKNGAEQKQLELIAEITYRNTAELGTIYAPFIASTKLFTDSVGLFGNAVNTEEARSASVERANNRAGLEKGDLAGSSFVITAQIRSAIEKSPYLMLPGGVALKEQMSAILDAGSNSAGMLLEKLPAFKLWKFSVKKKKRGQDEKGWLEKGTTTNEIGSFLLATYFMEKIIQYLPSVAIVAASLFVIAFYFISLFLYVLASPFVMAYAFANQQNEIIKSYVVRGVALAFKPVFIVLSVVVAIFAIDLIHSLNNMLVTNQFDLFFAITSAGAGDSLVDMWLIFTKSMLLIASSVIGILAAFYFVFFGSDLILKIFGFNEVGVDVQEVVGGQLEGKSSKFNTPMV